MGVGFKHPEPFLATPLASTTKRLHLFLSFANRFPIHTKFLAILSYVYNY